MFFPLAMLYGIYFTFHPRQLLGYELEEKKYNIFPPGPVFFLLVTEKLVKKLMGERKRYFFPISIFFPHGPCCIWFPFSDSYGTEVQKMMIFTLGLNVHSSACKFNDFVMNNPDNCFFNHFFFSSALLSLAIVGFIQINTLLTTLLLCR